VLLRRRRPGRCRPRHARHHRSGPVFAGLLGAALLRERVEASWLVATGTCVGGLALLSLAGGRGGVAGESGLLLALGSGAAYAAYTVAAKQSMRAGRKPADVMASAFSLGGLLLMPLLATQPLAWLTTFRRLAARRLPRPVTTTAAYLLFGRGLAVLAAGPVTTLVLAEPLVATALGVGVLASACRRSARRRRPGARRARPAGRGGHPAPGPAPRLGPGRRLRRLVGVVGAVVGQVVRRPAVGAAALLLVRRADAAGAGGRSGRRRSGVGKRSGTDAPPLPRANPPAPGRIAPVPPVTALVPSLDLPVVLLSHRGPVSFGRDPCRASAPPRAGRAGW
jgi:hypothetical protein